MCAGLDQLDFLALNYNQLVELGPAHFNGLQGLSSLELDYNKITKIHSAAFKGLEGEDLAVALTPAVFLGEVGIGRRYRVRLNLWGERWKVRLAASVGSWSS